MLTARRTLRWPLGTAVLVALAALLAACDPANTVPPLPPTQAAVLATPPPTQVVPTPTAMRLNTPTAASAPQATVQVVLPIVSAPGAATAVPASPPTPIPSPPSATLTPLPIHISLPLVNMTSSAYEDRGDPIGLLSSYYSAINLKDYQRAHGYWEKPQEGLEQFVKGYADTAAVLLVVRPPAHIEGAAGSLYASIPTLLVAIHGDGGRQTFSGCYVARKSNVPASSGDPKDNPWAIYSASIAAAPAGSDSASLLNQACPEAQGPQASPAYDDRSDPLGLLGSYYNAINRKDYDRAYSYWATPPSAPGPFKQGYADTAWVLAAAAAPPVLGAGLGNQFASIPTLLFANHTDGSQSAFVGCYRLQRVNPQIDGAPKDGAWHIAAATIVPVAAGADSLALLSQACATG